MDETFGYYGAALTTRVTNVYSAVDQGVILDNTADREPKERMADI